MSRLTAWSLALFVLRHFSCWHYCCRSFGKSSYASGSSSWFAWIVVRFAIKPTKRSQKDSKFMRYWTVSRFIKVSSCWSCVRITINRSVWKINEKVLNGMSILLQFKGFENKRKLHATVWLDSDELLIPGKKYSWHRLTSHLLDAWPIHRSGAPLHELVLTFV